MGLLPQMDVLPPPAPPSCAERDRLVRPSIHTGRYASLPPFPPSPSLSAPSASASMAPSVDTLANSVANTVSNGLNAAASNGHALKNRVPSAAGSLLPTTETVQRDLVERILADSSAHDEIHLDGYTLSLGDIVGAARYGRTVKVADRPDIREKLDASVNFLRTQYVGNDLPRAGRPSQRRPPPVYRE